MKMGERDDQAKVGYFGDSVGVELRSGGSSLRRTASERAQVSVSGRSRDTDEAGTGDQRFLVQLQRTRFPGIRDCQISD